MFHRIKNSTTQSAAAVRLLDVLCIGFVGQRIGSDVEAWRGTIRDFLLKEQAPPDRLLCGVATIAAEIDLIFAESCIELGIPLRLLLPFPGDHACDEFAEDTRVRAERVIESAVLVESIGDGQLRDNQWYECSLAVALQSQLLGAIRRVSMDAVSPRIQDVVEFAEQMGSVVVWLGIKSASGHATSLPVSCTAFRDKELSFLNNLPSGGMRAAKDSSVDVAEAWRAKLDLNAIRVAPQVHRLAAVPIVCTAVAAFVSGAGPRLRPEGVWLIAGILLGLIAAFLPTLLGLGKRQAMWVRIRTAAEVSRSVVALWDMPIRYEVVGSEVLPELGGMIRSLNFLKFQTRRADETDVFRFKQRYIEARLLDQERYFAKQAIIASRKARRYRLISRVCGVTGILTLAWMFGSRSLMKMSDAVSGGSWLPLVTAALFQIATIAGALVVVNDCDRRQKRFQELCNSLVRWKAELSAFQSWSPVIQVVNRIEQALLIELLEWRSLLQNMTMPRN